MKNFLASKLKHPLKMKSSRDDGVGSADDIILNGDFNNGLQGWTVSYGCTGSVCNHEKSQGCFIDVSGRTQGWQGIEQDITPRLSPNVLYEVTVVVKVAGSSSADIIATVRLESKGMETKYSQVGRTKASTDSWTILRGSLVLNVIPEKVTFYLEGPPAQTRILVDSVHIRKQQDSADKQMRHQNTGDKACLLQNPDFSNGLYGWSGRSCRLVLGAAAGLPHVTPCTGEHFVAATSRTETWQGVEQEVTGRLEANIIYEVRATVRLHGTNSKAEVLASLYQRKSNMQQQYTTIGRTLASSESWSTLEGKFTIHSVPSSATIYLEGPGAGVDILVDNFFVYPAKPSGPTSPPRFENPKFGCNVVENSRFTQELSGWFPMGSCVLHVLTAGAPLATPPLGKESLGYHKSYSGRYVVATNRKFGWEGPAQKLTERLQLFLCYQVSAWVRVGKGGLPVEKVNIALSVDGNWVTGGEVEASSETWKEIAGSFRLEKKPSEVFVYVQGPTPGVDIMLANLQIFSVNRDERLSALKMQAEQLRKRDIVLKLQSSSKLRFPVPVQVKQTAQRFALGACINRINLENSRYVDFLVRHFDTSVFENELKWGWTEPEKGKLNYREADELYKFCVDHKLPVRGHCVFWEVEGCVQPWVKKLSGNELAAAVDNRMTSLIPRYRGKFQHYDVNNEMLHGEFYKSRLGPAIQAHMFKRIHQLDSSARLFVNDYHIEDGRDAYSSPEKYVQHIQELISRGAPVGGIGIQGHVDVPVGPVLCQALDKLAVLGLPIWLTEVDVSSSNEHVRADDLEVVLREAFAHPAVEGVVLWGFWEGCSRLDGHLVNVDSTVNEAGKRLQALKREWQTEISGVTDSKGELAFRGHFGSYKVIIDVGNGKHVEKCFEVGPDEGRCEINI